MRERGYLTLLSRCYTAESSRLYGEKLDELAKLHMSEIQDEDVKNMYWRDKTHIIALSRIALERRFSKLIRELAEEPVGLLLKSLKHAKILEERNREIRDFGRSETDSPDIIHRIDEPMEEKKENSPMPALELPPPMLSRSSSTSRKRKTPEPEEEEEENEETEDESGIDTPSPIPESDKQIFGKVIHYVDLTED
jgi:hypothetical protein